MFVEAAQQPSASVIIVQQNITVQPPDADDGTKYACSCVCTCACVCVRVCACVCARVWLASSRTRTSPSSRKQISFKRVRLFACVCVCARVYVYICLCDLVSACVRVNKRVCVCLCVRMRASAYKCVLELNMIYWFFLVLPILDQSVIVYFRKRNDTVFVYDPVSRCFSCHTSYHVTSTSLFFIIKKSRLPVWRSQKHWNTCTHAHVRIHTRTHAHSHSHTYTQSHTNSHRHTQTHTHMHTNSLSNALAIW